MARMRARYADHCRECGEAIHVGDEIEYERATGARHATCEPFVTPQGAIWISVGQGYGGQPFHAGDVIRNPRHGAEIPSFYTEAEQAEEARRNAPLYLYVLHGRQDYYRDDGFSFGVGDESGYVYGAYCRPATDEESAPLRAEEQAQRTRVQARNRLIALERRVREQGEFPARGAVTIPAERETLLDTHNIYGGGESWVIAPGEIWYIEGNGGDGDNWAHNNITSAMAWRLSDPDGTIAAELRAIATVLEHGRTVAGSGLR